MTVGLTQEAQRRHLRPAQIALRATTENTENTKKTMRGPTLPVRLYEIKNAQVWLGTALVPIALP